MINTKLFLVFGFLWCFEAFHVGLEYLKNRKNLATVLKEKSSCNSPLEIFFRVVGGLNLLRGLFLFITFCCKIQVWNMVRKSCGRQKRPTMTGSVPKLNIKGATKTISATKDFNNSEGMSSIKLPVTDKRAASERAKKDQDDTESKRVGDHFECQHPDFNEKSIDDKVAAGELGNQGHYLNLFCSCLTP